MQGGEFELGDRVTSPLAPPSPSLLQGGEFELGDRVTSLGTGIPAFGLHGTVIGEGSGGEMRAGASRLLSEGGGFGRGGGSIRGRR